MSAAVTITGMQARHVRAATELALKVIPQDFAGNEHPGNSFNAALWMRYPVAGSVVGYVAARESVDAHRSLDYFVAEQGPEKKVVGVCGLYSILPGYLEKFGDIKEHFGPAIDPKRRDHFYLSWLGVEEGLRGGGIGRELVRACAGKALGIAQKEGSAESQLLVIAARGKAEDFYRKHGFTKVAVLGSGEPIYGADLRTLAASLDAKAAPAATALGDARARQQASISRNG